MLLSPSDLLYFFRLSRPLNLLIALLTYTLAAFLSAGRTGVFLTMPVYWLELLLLLAIMASGYWINDVYDFKIDRINKPHRTYVGAHLSRKKVLTAYFTVLGAGALASYWLPLKYLALNAAAILLLWLYARNFKRQSVVGNIVISCLTAAVVIAGAFLAHFTIALAWMTLFAFVITFLREITKDIEDIRGDLMFGLNTLPIQVGIRSAKMVLAVCYGVMLVCCHLPWLLHWLLWDDNLWQYAIASVLLVQVPLVMSLRLLGPSARPRDFTRQSQLLKLAIVGGLVSCLWLP